MLLVRRHREKRNRNFLRGAAVGLAVAFLMASCASDGDDGAAEREAPVGTLVVNTGTAPSSLDPAAEPNVHAGGLIVGSFYARLTKAAYGPGPDGTFLYDPNVDPEPWLAESWEVSDDERVYTFKLRPDLTFPSGNPVDADAVKYSIERVIEMGVGLDGVITDIQYDEQYESIEAPDPLTLVITLVRPNANLLKDLATPAAGVVDPSVVEEQGGIEPGEPNEWMATNVAGYGPYLLEEYSPRENLVMVANPDFFDPPAIERIEVNFVTSDPTLLLHARTGEADVTYDLSKEAAASLEGEPGVRLIVNETPLAETVIIPWTSSKYPELGNPVFREALAYAIPYEAILEDLAHGFATLFFGPHLPFFAEFNPEVATPLEYDIERAQRLVEESGVDTPLNWDVFIAEGVFTRQQIATVLQAEWAKLGINVNIQTVPVSDTVGMLYGPDKDEIVIHASGPYVVAADYFWDYYARCEENGNFLAHTQTCIPEADELIRELRATTDPEERQQIADEAARLWREEFPVLVVYGDQEVVVLSERVEDFYANSVPDMWRWSLQEP